MGVTEKGRLILEMAEQASVCPACDLAETRTKVVFGDGNPDSPLMLIGEGPGMNEDATGLPFVGRAGKLLDECLRDAGMLRKHIYLTNVVKCRPTLEEMGKIKNRPPRADEVGACVPLWLEKQIAVVQPLVILCLGAPAANTIIHRNFKMTQERGQWFESRYVRYAMAALHPAYILRQEGEAYDQARQTLVDDLIAARDKAKTAKNRTKDDSVLRTPMKRRASFALLLTLLLPICLAGKGCTSRDSDAIRAAYARLDAAYDRRDVAGALAFYAPDFVRHEAGGSQNLAQTRKRLTGDFQEAQSVTATTRITSLVIHGLEAEAMVRRRVEVTLPKPLPTLPPPYFVVEINQETWRKTPNGWRLTAMQETPLQRLLQNMSARDQAIRHEMIAAPNNPTITARNESHRCR